jgi:hypothetical protein
MYLALQNYGKMKNWIKSINGKIPYANKAVNIELDDKSPIITGARGTPNKIETKELKAMIAVVTFNDKKLCTLDDAISSRCHRCFDIRRKHVASRSNKYMVQSSCL